MAYVLGLTGSIGMGKTTTAKMLLAMGIPVWDADASVHQLYAPQGAAVPAIAAICPDALVNGAIDRNRLRHAIAENPKLLNALQDIVHPLVARERAYFLSKTPDPIVVLDIPLLFEIGADAQCDGVLVVSAPAELQRQRVLQRGITEPEFHTILARQMPDAEKRARATWVVETLSIAHVQQQLHQILTEIRKILPHARDCP